MVGGRKSVPPDGVRRVQPSEARCSTAITIQATDARDGLNHAGCDRERQARARFGPRVTSHLRLHRIPVLDHVQRGVTCLFMHSTYSSSSGAKSSTRHLGGVFFFRSFLLACLFFFFLRVWLFCRFFRRQGAHVCFAHIPVFSHAVGGFELYNHLFCTLRYALSVCLCGGMDGWDVVVWRCGEQSLPEKKQRGSYGISEGGVFLVPIWPLCGILRFYDCDSRAFSLRLSFVEDVMGGVEFGGGTGLDWMGCLGNIIGGDGEWRKKTSTCWIKNREETRHHWPTSLHPTGHKPRKSPAFVRY